MVYLYDNAIVDDLTKSFNGHGDNLVRVCSPEETIGLAAQLNSDNIKFPIIALSRPSSWSIDADRWHYTQVHKGVSASFDKKNNIYYDEKALPITLSYDLTILTTRTADMDELLKEILFKYTQQYFLTIQLPYECDRKIRFGVAIDPDTEIERSSASKEYIESGKLYQSIIRLNCQGCVLVSYTPVKLKTMEHVIETHLVDEPYIQIAKE